LLHDLSKYSPAEFISGAKYYLGTRSPNEKEREIFGYSLAWLHHKGRNKHHFEYWVDLDPAEKKYVPVPMPLNYVTEMFCDRVAASKIYQGEKYKDSSALEYYNRGNAREKMHVQTADMLESFGKTAPHFEGAVCEVLKYHGLLLIDIGMQYSNHLTSPQLRA
jgi:hypothetical protein